MANDSWLYSGSNSTRIASPHAPGKPEVGNCQSTVRAAGTCGPFTHCAGLIPMAEGPR
jgi:hypothetical protein